MKHVKIIGFDADDTLWLNELFYQETEQQFCRLLAEFGDEEAISKALFATEMKNMVQYGYGAKAFILSLIETALQVSNYRVAPQTIQKIIELGKSLLNRPVVLLDGVEQTLKAFHGNYPLLVITKGDLLDQQRKLRNSGLAHYFHHVEIMSDKTEEDYTKLLQRLNIRPEEFLMIGNSMKSDVLPVLQLGGYAIHVPHQTTWLHEKVEEEITHLKLNVVDKIVDVLKILNK